MTLDYSLLYVQTMQLRFFHRNPTQKYRMMSACVIYGFVIFASTMNEFEIIYVSCK